jgi:hypothetical protein
MLKIGQQVIIYGKRRTISYVYCDIKGGFHVNNPVRGFYSWNVDDDSVVLTNSDVEWPIAFK